MKELFLSNEVLLYSYSVSIEYSIFDMLISGVVAIMIFILAWNKMHNW